MIVGRFLAECNRLSYFSERGDIRLGKHHSFRADHGDRTYDFIMPKCRHAHDRCHLV